MDGRTYIQAINKIISLLQDYSSKELLDEDGNKLFIEKAEAVPMEMLERFEKLHQLRLPDDLRDFLLFSNGINIFGTKIYSLDEMELFPENKVLSFHSWGNGDFDCISVDNGDEYGRVFFMNHSVSNLVSINISFVEWVFGVIREIECKGVLLHPMDYRIRRETGMYKDVSYKLKII